MMVLEVMVVSSWFDELSFIIELLLSIVFALAWMWTGDTHWWRWAVIAGVWAAADNHHDPLRQNDD
jgi:hypothetical protein